METKKYHYIEQVEGGLLQGLEAMEISRAKFYSAQPGVVFAAILGKVDDTPTVRVLVGDEMDSRVRTCIEQAQFIGADSLTEF